MTLILILLWFCSRIFFLETKWRKRKENLEKKKPILVTKNAYLRKRYKLKVLWCRRAIIASYCQQVLLLWMKRNAVDLVPTRRLRHRLAGVSVALYTTTSMEQEIRNSSNTRITLLM
jgi:hypothetical protein